MYSVFSAAAFNTHISRCAHIRLSANANKCEFGTMTILLLLLLLCMLLLLVISCYLSLSLIIFLQTSRNKIMYIPKYVLYNLLYIVYVSLSYNIYVNDENILKQ